MRQLINYLKENPEVEKVYFDETGSWLFNKKDSHCIEKSRDEVLEMEDDLEPEEVTEEEATDLVTENILLKQKVEILKEALDAESVEEEKEILERADLVDEELAKLKK